MEDFLERCIPIFCTFHVYLEAYYGHSCSQLAQVWICAVLSAGISTSCILYRYLFGVCFFAELTLARPPAITLVYTASCVYSSQTLLTEAEFTVL
jgi:hypothetical protein